MSINVPHVQLLLWDVFCHKHGRACQWSHVPVWKCLFWRHQYWMQSITFDKDYRVQSISEGSRWKSGYPIQFSTYLRRHGIESVPLAQFWGNRFNIIFLDGAQVYYLHKHIIDFLQKWLGPWKKFLKGILDDANNELHIAGCKALGLIDKLITGPLWLSWSQTCIY